MTLAWNDYSHLCIQCVFTRNKTWYCSLFFKYLFRHNVSHTVVTDRLIKRTLWTYVYPINNCSGFHIFKNRGYPYVILLQQKGSFVSDIGAKFRQNLVKVATIWARTNTLIHRQTQKWHRWSYVPCYALAMGQITKAAQVLLTSIHIPVSYDYIQEA